MHYDGKMVSKIHSFFFPIEIVSNDSELDSDVSILESIQCDS